MSRTQVYLREGELELLERASRDTGASRSELIRRAATTLLLDTDLLTTNVRHFPMISGLAPPAEPRSVGRWAGK